MKIVSATLAVGLWVTGATAAPLFNHVEISAHVTDFWKTSLFDPEHAPDWLKNPRQIELNFELNPDSLSVSEFGFSYDALGLGNLIVDGRSIDASFLYASMDRTFNAPPAEGASLTGGGALPDLGPNGALQYLSYSLQSSTSEPFQFDNGFVQPLSETDFDLGGQFLISAFDANTFMPVYRITAEIDRFRLLDDPAPVPEPVTYGLCAAAVLLATALWRRVK
ncbi:MAG TPA: hypothetical protein VFT72_06615 [Opitutaceae bacterium]|nr:hypothetical protein [Opitutaceae bacterium]